MEQKHHSTRYYRIINTLDDIWHAKGKILAFVVVLGFMDFLFVHQYDFENGVREIQTEQQKQVDVDNKINSVVRTSVDCYNLQQTLLTLVSYGANSESWMPNLYDLDLKSCILNGKGVFLVALKDDQLVGFIYGCVETPSTACLTYIAIKESFRKQGIGESLFNSWLATIMDFGISTVYVLASNPYAQAFFIEMGFCSGKKLTYLEKAIPR